MTVAATATAAAARTAAAAGAGCALPTSDDTKEEPNDGQDAAVAAGRRMDRQKEGTWRAPISAQSERL